MVRWSAVPGCIYQGSPGATARRGFGQSVQSCSDFKFHCLLGSFVAEVFLLLIGSYYAHWLSTTMLYVSEKEKCRQKNLNENT